MYAGRDREPCSAWALARELQPCPLSGGASLMYRTGSRRPPAEGAQFHRPILRRSSAAPLHRHHHRWGRRVWMSHLQQVLACFVACATSGSAHHQPAAALVLHLLPGTAHLRPDPPQESQSKCPPCPSTSMASPCCAPGPAGCTLLGPVGSPGGSPGGPPGGPQEVRARIWARRDRCSWVRAPHISSQACSCGRTLSMRPAHGPPSLAVLGFRVERRLWGLQRTERVGGPGKKSAIDAARLRAAGRVDTQGCSGCQHLAFLWCHAGAAAAGCCRCGLQVSPSLAGHDLRVAADCAGWWPDPPAPLTCRTKTANLRPCLPHSGRCRVRVQGGAMNPGRRTPNTTPMATAHSQECAHSLQASQKVHHPGPPSLARWSNRPLAARRRRGGA